MAKLKEFIPIEIEERLSFEILLTEIASDFVNLPSEHIDEAIIKAQERICNHLSLDRSVLWQLIEDASGEMWLSHVHEVSESYLPATPFDAGKTFPWILEQILLGSNVTIERVEDLPSEAHQDRQSLSQWGVKSSFVMPLAADEKIIGALSFGKLSQEIIWSKNVKQRLQLIAQIFANALSRKKAEESMASLRRFEALVTDISAQFVNLPADRIDAEIEDAQRRICECLEVDLSTLWQWSDKKPHSLVLTHLHSPSYGPERPKHLEAQEAFPWKFEQLKKGNVVSHTTSEMPPEANRDIESYQAFGIKSSVGIPLSAGGGPLVGILSFEDLKTERSWPEAILKRLTMVAQIFSNALTRKRSELKLREQLKKIEALRQKLENENVYLRREIELQQVHGEIVSRSPAMKQIMAQVEQVARTEATVLIEGETGTGKELVARTIHRLSARQRRPLITVNCAALPPTLVESELFGREKGAYTGALTRMAGRFEAAHGATLFLDEIGELPIEVQAKLLRVLEQGCFERLGSTRVIDVDVRIIAATNQHIAHQVAAGKFRKDLFYRLNVYPLCLPPLRERPEDIPPLVWYFVRQNEEKLGRRIDRIPQKCMADLQRYGWPGNIRELRNLVERAMISSNSRTLDVRPFGETAEPNSKPLTLKESERKLILEALKQSGWRISGRNGAAEMLGLKRTTLQAKMKKLGIQRLPS